MVIQLTKKCNLNCFYCKHHRTVAEELTMDQIRDIVAFSIAKGDSVIDLYGGEPLTHPRIIDIVREIKQMPGVEKVTLTTNGVLLPERLEELKSAGIDGINIHMDASDSYNYTEITGAEMVMNDVLRGLWTAVARDIPAALSIGLHEKSRSSLVVLTSFAKKMDICIRFVDIGAYSKEAGLNEDTVLELLNRHIKGIYKDGDMYRSPELKGKLIFTDRFEEAFE